MKAASGKEFARMLEARGWLLERIHGSHHIYAKAGNPVRISVPIHGMNLSKSAFNGIS